MSFPVRLLNTSTFELYKGSHSDVRKDPRYAILSHRWGDDEVELKDLDPVVLRSSTSTNSPAINKIRGACKTAQARKPPIGWLWMDTCCIDKTSAVEETRSINAMFDWYGQAEVCITYLHDVQAFPDPDTAVFKRIRDDKLTDEESEWFERGWTLQELLAPERMDFYDWNWNPMGTREGLAEDIERVTGIATKYLQGPSNLSEASIATKFSWMAGRVTGQVEDIAYSMIGLLNVNMTPQYGERRKSFMRLQRALVETIADESIFAWTVPPAGLQCFRRSGSASSAPQWHPQEDRWGLLAPSPDCFRDSRDIIIIGRKIVLRPGGGYRFTSQGMHFDLAYAQGRGRFFGSHKSSISFPLNCWKLNSAGKAETVRLRLVSVGQWYQRERCSERLETKAGAKVDNNHVLGRGQLILAPIIVLQPEAPR